MTSPGPPSNSITNPSNPQRIQSLKTFLASDEPITIIPSFNYKAPLTFLLTQSSIGPFHAGVNTTAPIWLAIYLRKRNLCRLVAPSWMDLDHLKAVVSHERNNHGFSDQLPFRYMEISRLILQACGAGRSQVHASTGGGGSTVQMEEVPNAEQVRVLLEDISTVRMDKIRLNVHAFSKKNLSQMSAMPVLDVTGIGAVEMAAVKPFLEAAFTDHLKFVQTGAARANAGDGAGTAGNAAISSSGENREEQGTTNALGDSATVASAAPNAAVSRSRLRRFR